MIPRMKLWIIYPAILHSTSDMTAFIISILQSSDNSRAPCKVADESAAVDSRVCGEGDIEWESILSNSQEEMPRTGAIHHPWEAGACKFRIREIAVGKVQGSFGLDRITELYD